MVPLDWSHGVAIEGGDMVALAIDVEEYIHLLGQGVLGVLHIGVAECRVMGVMVLSIEYCRVKVIPDPARLICCWDIHCRQSHSNRFSLVHTARRKSNAK